MTTTIVILATIIPENLRWATRAEQRANSRKPRLTLMPGVHCTGRQWRATISNRRIGIFKTEFEASLAYALEAEKVYGSFLHKEVRDFLAQNRHRESELHPIPTRRAQYPRGVTKTKYGTFAVSMWNGSKMVLLKTCKTLEEAEQLSIRSHAERNRVDESQCEGDEKKED